MGSAPSDWQLGCMEMKQRGAHLLQSGQWSDCTFLVGTEPHQVVVSGHKLILAMASPVFEAMFYGGMAERNDPIPILDVQPEAFKALLEYIYTDNINICSFDKACELCYGAKKYMLPHLVKECTRYLWSDLYPRNACRAYEFARLFEENVLMEKCLQIISTNTKEVLNDSSFLEVELNTVITVFSLDHLNVDSELDLFEAAVRYAKGHDKRNLERSVSPVVDQRPSPGPSTSKDKVVNIESSAENSPVGAEGCASAADVGPAGDAPVTTAENQQTPDKGDVKEKSKIRSIIENIRFLTLTAQQFAEGPARSSLLSETEAFAVLMNILSSNSAVPMPNGFSTNRVPRKQLIGGGAQGSSNMPTFTVDTPSPVGGETACPMERMDRLERLERPANPHNPALALPAISHPHHACPLSYPRPSRFDGMRLHSAVHVPVSGIMGEFNKIYCQRAILQQTDCLNTSVLDCSVTFMVDKNICLLGVQVPTQAPSEESAVQGLNSAVLGGPTGYSELLYAHLLDADGARLTYTHYTSRVPYRHLLDIMFNRPVYIQRNKVYKVGIVFNKMGWYPLGTCAQQVAAESVFFNFGIGQSSDSVRDGLIRSIIFSY
ncbi:uncharacterized protein LOC113234075 isoform X2 [Hyposmocoma kahamanoa]|uniref:uncharacterized protein LOC113234075 isoform X2 n=1 Tax=Hyposmocoma kahamanoa TaxID=1477025 RepID=UPI000E6D77F1|nr:uncharacterized protein LOC113234075 isoform X2 [Hyposmocoma kahamanoa]